MSDRKEVRRRIVDAATPLLRNEGRDPTLADRLRDAIIGAITTTVPSSASSAGQRAVGLKAVLDEVADLYSPSERALLGELLDRAANHTPAR